MKNLIARRNQPFLASFFCSKTTADLSPRRYDTWKVNEKCLEIAIDIGARFEKSIGLKTFHLFP